RVRRDPYVDEACPRLNDGVRITGKAINNEWQRTQRSHRPQQDSVVARGRPISDRVPKQGRDVLALDPTASVMDSPDGQIAGSLDLAGIPFQLERQRPWPVVRQSARLQGVAVQRGRGRGGQGLMR